jgi:amidophosphoribosyltransferase
MSDEIKHECGIALIRLLKPLSYYKKKYGTALYGLNKLWLLMEKQHNRGQDGAGIANIKLDMPPGHRYISRYRSSSPRALNEIAQKINNRFADIGKKNPKLIQDTEWMKRSMPFTGELYLGHLRYGTYGSNGTEKCHPFVRQNNWKTRNLVLAGNFNLTNVDELFSLLVDLGQFPKEKSDTTTVLEKIGHFLDEENEELFRKFKPQGHDNRKISELIAEEMDVCRILTKASKTWDGGYAMAGLLGHGDAFVLRDPCGIRPAYWYCDDEVAVVTSERPPIQTAFNVPMESIREIKPGHALIIKKNGKISEEEVSEPKVKKSCSFERIYFSRGNDIKIYSERKRLGRLLVSAILETVDYDFEHTVFSYIPNTAESAFFGMKHGLDEYLEGVKKNKILALGKNITSETLDKILTLHPRIEKIAVKDAKLRTFITDDVHRSDLVHHVYDITYGSLKRGTDTLVVIDDSIVRGTTLRNSILRILDRLGPKKIIIVSSAPQIRFPDCYGIDMARIGDLIAFQAAIELLHENNKEELVDDVYEKCKLQETLPREKAVNCVKAIYAPFTYHQVSEKIAKLVRPADLNAEVQIIFQTIENLHKAIPTHTGDWYFSGDYPTPGGNKVANRAFINYVEKRSTRAY